MGLLRSFGFGAPNPYDPYAQQTMPGVPPIVQPQAPQGQGAGPPMFPTPQAQQPQAQPAPQQGGWWNRFQTGMEGLPNNAMFNMGLSLLGNAQRGGDWGGVGRDMQQFGQNQMLRKRNENEEKRLGAQERRDETTFGRQQQMWGQQDQTTEAWRQAVQMEQDPQRRATLQAIGPEGYGQYLSQQQQMEYQSRENQLNRDNDRRVAATRSANENSLGRYFQSMDAQTIGDLNQQSAQLQAVGLPQLYALKDTINQAGLSLTGQPIDYNNRITLGRYFNGSSADRQNLEVWRAQILGPALESLRGLGAMSERELDAAMNSFANPNMTLGAAQQLIDQRIQLAQRRVDTANHANQYFQQYGGLTGSGPGWPAYLSEQLGNELQPGAGGGGGQGNAPTAPAASSSPPPEAVNELRRDSSAAARREFDAVFGPGAAARALASRAQQRTPQAARGGRPGAF